MWLVSSQYWSQYMAQKLTEKDFWFVIQNRADRMISDFR